MGLTAKPRLPSGVAKESRGWRWLRLQAGYAFSRVGIQGGIHGKHRYGWGCMWKWYAQSAHPWQGWIQSRDGGAAGLPMSARHGQGCMVLLPCPLRLLLHGLIEAVAVLQYG